MGRKIIETLEQSEYYFRAKRIEVISSVMTVFFYYKMGYVYKSKIRAADCDLLFEPEKNSNTKIPKMK